MSQFAAAVKNPPWVRGATGNLAQPPPPGTTALGTSLLAAQAQHASTGGAATGLGATATAVPAGSLATAAAVVAAAQTQQAQQAPAVSAAYGTGLAAITLTQSALQQGAVLPQGIAIPASLATTTQVGTVNSGVVVALERLPQPGVALPTSLATTQVATVSYPAPRLLAQTAQFQAAQPHAHQAAVVQQVTAQPHGAAQQQQPQQQQQQQQQPQPAVAKQQRVFTGTVTKLHENFGFVDEDVFFQLSVVKGNMPKVGERVLVEASYNANMPFKWNATRIQVLPNQVNVQPGSSTRTAISAQPSAVAATVLASPVSVNLNVPTGVSLNAAIANIANNQAQYASVASAGRWQVQQEIPAIEQMSQQRLGIQYDGRMDNPHSWVKEVDYNDMVENKAQQRLGIQFEGRLDNSHPWVQEMDYSEMVESKVPRINAVQRRHNSPPISRRERDRERESRREERRERMAYREIDRYPPPAPSRKRSRSPRRPSRSPPRRRQRMAPRYTVQIPKISLDMREANVMELKKRYSNLYIPSDFCSARLLWQEAFPPHQAFSMDHQCSFYVMSKDVDPIMEADLLPEATDTDHIYSAKVMLMSVPSLKEVFRKSCALAEDPEDIRENFVHPTRLISFLVGLKGKNETVAIGGPWSPSLDGPNPEKDPSVLIRTAIRTCRALTGIDLSKCSQWYRFAEIYYRRAETTHKGRAVPARIETVVLFLPDVWSCLPTRVEWDGLVTSYKKQLQGKLQEESEDTTDTQEEDENLPDAEKKEPTHYSELDPKTIKLNDVKQELEARNLSTKGLKSQLIARLTKALKQELEKEETGEQHVEMIEATDSADKQDLEDAVDDDKKKKEGDEKKTKEERERVAVEKRIQLPDSPSVIVHPSRTAKGGKFDCTIMSLSLLLDYRQEDNKEHSFEVSLFAEIFNEMMMRDFGFRIYCSLVEAPETKDDEKDKEKKKSDKKEDKRDRKEEKDDRRKDDFENDSDDYDSDEDEEEDGDKKDKEKRKRKKKKLQKYTNDPFLLLSYVYFDQTHCGYLLEKDLEDILYTLGLQLSRAQVRRLTQKVCKKDSSVFCYRKLTDRPVGDVDKTKSSESSKVNLEELAIGNRKCSPLFKNSPKELSSNHDVTEDIQENEYKEAVVMHQGALVDVGKLLNQLLRSEKARMETEQKLKSLEEQFETVNSLATMKVKHSQKLSYDLDDQKHKLCITEEQLQKSRALGEKYHCALTSCRETLYMIISNLDSTLNTKPAHCPLQKSGDTLHISERETENVAFNGCNHEQLSLLDPQFTTATECCSGGDMTSCFKEQQSCDKTIENKTYHHEAEGDAEGTADKKFACIGHLESLKGSSCDEENLKVSEEETIKCIIAETGSFDSCSSSDGVNFNEKNDVNLPKQSETNSDILRVTSHKSTLSADDSGSHKFVESIVPEEMEHN